MYVQAAGVLCTLISSYISGLLGSHLRSSPCAWLGGNQGCQNFQMFGRLKWNQSFTRLGQFSQVLHVLVGRGKLEFKYTHVIGILYGIVLYCTIPYCICHGNRCSQLQSMGLALGFWCGLYFCSMYQFLDHFTDDHSGYTVVMKCSYCNDSPPGIFLSPDLHLEYWIELIAMNLICIFL